MFIVNHRKIFFTLSGLLVLGSLLAPFIFGVHFSTDFLGGSILQVTYTNPSDVPSVDNANQSLAPLALGDFSIRPSGNTDLIIRSVELSPSQKNAVEAVLSKNGTVPMKEDLFNAIGPTVSQSLKQKSYIAIGLVILCIVLFITFAFRKVSQPVSSWKYGVATIVALAHDVIIPTGVYLAFSRYLGAEVDLLFVTALLAILGYSVHDTIVVFDRVRENLRHNQEYRSKETFEETVGKSVTQTMGRSINTSLTIFLTLLALFLVGGETTRPFAFTLLIGIITGTYSSIFIASPFLVTLEKWQSKKK